MKYQPDQSIVDYNDWDLATSSVITGDFTTDSLKYGFGPTTLRAEGDTFRVYRRMSWEQYFDALETGYLMSPKMRNELDGFVNSKSFMLQDLIYAATSPSWKSPLPHLQDNLLPTFEIELLPTDDFKKFDSGVVEIKNAIPVDRVTPFSTTEEVSFFEAEDNYEATYGKEQAKIRRRLKNKIMAQAIMGTAVGEWSARKSQELKRQYEAACEKAGLKPYKGSKTKKQQDLSDWSKQKWKTASGKKSSVTGEPYFPAKAVEALKQNNLYAKAKRQKAAATKAGKQNARYSDDIRKVVKQFRVENWVDLGYQNAPTPEQLKSQIEAGYHDNPDGNVGCPNCGNIDLFWKKITSKGQTFRCLSCEWTDNYETVKSQGDITLEKFGLTFFCDICEKEIKAYNKSSLDSHLRKHQKEAVLEADSVVLEPSNPAAGWYNPKDDSVNINLSNKGLRKEALEDKYVGLFDTLAHEYGHKVTLDDTSSPYQAEFAAFMVQTNGDFARSKLLAVVHPSCLFEILSKLPSDSEGIISDQTLDDYFSTLDLENNMDILVQAKRMVQYPAVPEWHKDWLRHFIRYAETGTCSEAEVSEAESPDLTGYVYKGRPIKPKDRKDAESVSTQGLLNWINRPVRITESYDFPSEPVRCIYCGSDDITTDGLEADGEGTVTTDVTCEAEGCGAIWRDYFRYVDTEVIVPTSLTLDSESFTADEQLEIEIEGIDETYGLVPTDPEIFDIAESAFYQYQSRTDLPETFRLPTKPHFTFVSADAFDRSNHVARFRSQTASHIPIIMLSSNAIRESADYYGVPLRTAVATTIWHEIGHILCELWDMEEIYPFETSNEEEEFAESIAESMYFQEPFQNPVELFG